MDPVLSHSDSIFCDPCQCIFGRALAGRWSSSYFLKLDPRRGLRLKQLDYPPDYKDASKMRFIASNGGPLCPFCTPVLGVTKKGGKSISFDYSNFDLEVSEIQPTRSFEFAFQNRKLKIAVMPERCKFLLGKIFIIDTAADATSEWKPTVPSKHQTRQ